MPCALRTFLQPQKDLELLLPLLQSLDLFYDLLELGECFISHGGLFVRDALLFFCDSSKSFVQ